jgi:hypothetical protein
MANFWIFTIGLMPSFIALLSIRRWKTQDRNTLSMDIDGFCGHGMQCFVFFADKYEEAC